MDIEEGIWKLCSLLDQLFHNEHDFALLTPLSHVMCNQGMNP